MKKMLVHALDCVLECELCFAALNKVEKAPIMLLMMIYYILIIIEMISGNNNIEKL